MMRFRTWLIANYLNDDSPIGDLAYDTFHDGKFTKKNSRSEILGYLRSRNACYECIDAFNSAWRLYERYKKKVTNERKGNRGQACKSY